MGPWSHMHDHEASGRLVTTLYSELRELAARQMRRQPRNHTLQVTDLVHEAYVRLAGGGILEPDDHPNFFAAAARAMRCVLVDHARSKGRVKRQAPGRQVPLDALCESFEAGAMDLLALDEALEKLAAFDPTMARAVELRFFAGLDVPRTAELLEIPQRTFERHWATTRAWLYKQVS